MGWKRYALAVLAFNILGIIAVYALQRLQGMLPLNPAGMGPVSPDSALNTAISFVANTNWQGYGGESTMSYLTQMLALTVQNFVSAATGIAVLFALIRGLARHCSATLGNFWTDMVRSTLYVLLPLSLILALALVSQGVIQNFSPYVEAQTVEALHYDQPRVDAQGQPVLDAAGQPVTDPAVTQTQTLAMGPVASQEAIKLLGTNGGGFFNANSAHPYENATPLANFLEMLAILIIPAALCFVRRDGRQPQAGHRGAGGDDGAVRRFRDQRGLFRATGQSDGGAGRRGQRPRPSRPAATWKARKPASASPPPRCSPP